MMIKIFSLLVILVSFVIFVIDIFSWSFFRQHVALSIPVNEFDGYFYEKPGISLGFNENDIGLGLNNNADFVEDQVETEDVCSPCCETLGHDLGSQCDECVCLPPPVNSPHGALKSLSG